MYIYYAGNGEMNSGEKNRNPEREDLRISLLFSRISSSSQRVHWFEH